MNNQLCQPIIAFNILRGRPVFVIVTGEYCYILEPGKAVHCSRSYEMEQYVFLGFPGDKIDGNTLVVMLCSTYLVPTPNITQYMKDCITKLKDYGLVIENQKLDLMFKIGTIYNDYNTLCIRSEKSTEELFYYDGFTCEKDCLKMLETLESALKEFGIEVNMIESSYE